MTLSNNIYIQIKVVYAIPELNLKKFEYNENFLNILFKELSKYYMVNRDKNYFYILDNNGEKEIKLKILPRIKHKLKSNKIKFRVYSNLEFSDIQRVSLVLKKIISESINTNIYWDSPIIRRSISEIPNNPIARQILSNQPPLIDPIAIRSKIIVFKSGIFDYN